MKRLTPSPVLAALALCIGVHGVRQAIAQTSDQPNIIFILTDDQGTESIEADHGQGEIFGNEMDCDTPTMDRLSEFGVSFTNCRVNPNCSPTRAGLMTGRRALSTGVTGVLAHYQTGGDAGIDPCLLTQLFLTNEYAQATDLMSLQNYERTIAEALQAAGYYTILVDKWHLGGDHVGFEQGDQESRETTPDQQGFNLVYDWKDYLCLDDPDDDTDLDHMARMADLAYQAADAVTGQPYALFFHTISPHRRAPAGEQLHWYKPSDDLLIDELEGLPPSEENRFLQNVNAIDTSIRRHLLLPLGVIDVDDPGEFLYIDESNTIVFLLGDNGTDKAVSWFNDRFQNNHAKNSPYEGGIRVPLIVFGEKISGEFDPLGGTIDESLISHLDFFDTLADVGNVTPGSGEQNRNADGDPFKERHGVSFADLIGYTVQEQYDAPDYTLSFYGYEEPGDARASFVSAPDPLLGHSYKLIMEGGSIGFAGPAAFYRLDVDEYEDHNAVNPGEGEEQYGLVGTEVDKYLDMRDLIVNYWPLSVSPPNISVTNAYSYSAELYAVDQATQHLYLLVVHVVEGTLLDSVEDEFYNLTLNPNLNLRPNLDALPQSIQDLYWGLRDDAVMDFGNGTLEAASDICFIDLPLMASGVASNPAGSFSGSGLAVGHESLAGGAPAEHRAFLKFNIGKFDDLVPYEFDYTDVVRAQIIVGFKQDSTTFTSGNFDEFWENDAPTGPIRVRRVTAPWTHPDIFNQISLTYLLGKVELPPHIVVGETLLLEDLTKLRETPMREGTPVSFGHYQDVRSRHSAEDMNDLALWFKNWYEDPVTYPNYGVALVADYLDNVGPGPDKDQHVVFQRAAVLRLTLKRNQ